MKFRLSPIVLAGCAVLYAQAPQSKLAAPKISLVNDIIPILTKSGCASSNCHGSIRGQAGFKLSLFGYEPDLIRREGFPPRPQYLPRPLTPSDDQLLGDELRRTDDLPANALLLTRATGIRIGECIDLALDCLPQVGPNQWALHVPLGKLHTERQREAQPHAVPVLSAIHSATAADIPGIRQALAATRHLAAGFPMRTTDADYNVSTGGFLTSPVNWNASTQPKNEERLAGQYAQHNGLILPSAEVASATKFKTRPILVPYGPPRT